MLSHSRQLNQSLEGAELVLTLLDRFCDLLDLFVLHGSFIRSTHV